jgi:hypothetical protein
VPASPIFSKWGTSGTTVGIGATELVVGSGSGHGVDLVSFPKASATSCGSIILAELIAFEIWIGK